MYIKILGVPFKSQELWDYILFFCFCFFSFFPTKGYWFQQNPVCFMLQTLTLNYEYIACLHVLVVRVFSVGFFFYSPNSLGFS